MAESCPVWRLYGAASENHQTVVGKHAEARGKGDQNTTQILSHELNIVESSLRAVRRELRHHEGERHRGQQGR